MFSWTAMPIRFMVFRHTTGDLSQKWSATGIKEDAGGEFGGSRAFGIIALHIKRCGCVRSAL
jgi:hypothetical protein